MRYLRSLVCVVAHSLVPAPQISFRRVLLNKCQEEFESYAASQEEIIKNMSDLEKEEH